MFLILELIKGGEKLLGVVELGCGDAENGILAGYGDGGGCRAHNTLRPIRGGGREMTSKESGAARTSQRTRGHGNIVALRRGEGSDRIQDLGLLLRIH